MKFNNIMHVCFITKNYDAMVEFYEKIGGKIKALTKFKVYADRDDRPDLQKVAKLNPEGVFSCYMELAPGQFLEFFPNWQVEERDPKWNYRFGYSHFALTVDDIFEARKELEKLGIKPDTEPSKGPSETWQMWLSDPDGNKFEIMQYTDKSYQVVGHID